VLSLSRKYFGTDGIRGRVGENPVTPDFMLKLGWAAGRVLSKNADGSKLILIGKDTRISGYMFESALEAGLINAGVDVGLLGPMPTPAIAYLTQAFRAQAGIVISASHNPYYDNGIKFFCGKGAKLPDVVEAEIEAELDHVMTSAEQLGKARRIDDAAGRYIEFCKGTLPRSMKLSSLKVVLDCANGATYQVAPNVFRELGATVDVIHAEPDGFNINEGCGSTVPERLQKRVKEIDADLGIAFDGDGDRVVFVDGNGDIVDGDELLYIISSACHKERGCSGVVGTLMSNYGLELAFKRLGIPFARANVGDRHVIQKMKENNWTLGGESSGHIICSNVTTTGDGIISALQVVYALGVLDAPLAEAKHGMCKMPQKMINVRIKQKVDISQIDDIQNAVASAEERLGNAGRVLLRPSGTEPLIRVMVEGEDIELVAALAEELAAVVGEALAV
jgi:phosphoglucosamine mutase